MIPSFEFLASSFHGFMLRQAGLNKDERRQVRAACHMSADPRDLEYTLRALYPNKTGDREKDAEEQPAWKRRGGKGDIKQKRQTTTTTRFQAHVAEDEIKWDHEQPEEDHPEDHEAEEEQADTDADDSELEELQLLGAMLVFLDNIRWFMASQLLHNSFEFMWMHLSAKSKANAWA